MSQDKMKVSLLLVGRALLQAPGALDTLAARLDTVHAVDDGMEGFMAFAKYRPDILFTDIDLSKMDAVSLAKAVRHIKPETPVIFAVDFSDPDSLRQALNVGLASFAAKPLTPDSILRSVSDVAELVTGRRALEDQRHLSEMTLKSLPHPAMLIDRATRRIILTNSSAEDLGFAIGTPCEGPLFANRAFARPEQARSFDDYVTYYASIETREVTFAHRIWDVVLTQLAGGRILFSAIDVTDRKKAEDELREAHAGLEKRVLDRTAELNKANTVLRREIATRKKIEDLLKAGEEKYRALAENSPDLIARFDRDLRFIFVNPALASAAITPPELYLGKTAFEAEIPNRLRETLRPHILEVFNSLQPTQAQFPFACQPGICYYDWRIIPEYGPDNTVQTVLSIARDITEIKHVEEKLRQLATTDALTNVANRRHFLETAERELARAMRYNLPLAILMLDADHFKNVNDTYGHDIGDAVLKLLAQTCQSSLREIDLFGRLGGEEFAALLPETDLPAALTTAERLRAAIQANPLATPSLAFTVSIGVACRTPADTKVDDILKRADDGLYKAKESGRNQVALGDTGA